MTKQFIFSGKKSQLINYLLKKKYIIVDDMSVYTNKIETYYSLVEDGYIILFNKDQSTEILINDLEDEIYNDKTLGLIPIAEDEDEYTNPNERETMKKVFDNLQRGNIQNKYLMASLAYQTIDATSQTLNEKATIILKKDSINGG